jgi:rhomboid protease GluP
MLDIKTIAIYLFISSIAYRYLLFPKKIISLRGLQLFFILTYDILLVTNLIKINQITFFISAASYFIFLLYPQIEAKRILSIIITSDGSNEKNIENKLKKLFFLTFDFNAFKYEHGLIEYFLKMIAQNSEKIPESPQKITSIIKRKIPHITYILMIIIITMFLITNNDDIVNVQFNLIKYGGNFHNLVVNGEYFRFFSSIFLHANWIHLLMNGFALFYLGIFVERIAITRSFYFSIFIIGGVLASMSSFFLAKQNSVGASGAIFALIGALFSIIFISKGLIDNSFRKKILRDVIFIIVINILLGLSLDNIDNYAHMGGLVSGSLLTYLLYKLNNKVIFKLFDLTAILIVIYGSFFLYTNIKMSYPQTINFTSDITISSTSFKIPNEWSKVTEKNNSLYQDLFLSRFIMENVTETNFNASKYISKETIEKEFNISSKSEISKKITSFDNTSFKVNKIKIKLIKFKIEFDKKNNDIRVGRIYFFKFNNTYFRFMAVFFKESYDKYGDIMTRFLEFNLK